MTMIRLGYVAMSVHLKNCSPSQTMTYAQFTKMKNRTAAIHKLERIAISNLNNCLRLLKHNAGNNIHFFRFSSKLIPLANHEELLDWNYMKAIKEPLIKIKNFLEKQSDMRVDFHPDHFVLFNSPKVEILNNSIRTLAMHEALLKGMGQNPTHRCVIHIGGGYDDKEKALEQFINNWGYIPPSLAKMIMLENDDNVFNINDTLYLCEKIGIPMVFDLHHHEANHESDWESQWERIIATWDQSPLPMKIHISSPKSEKQFKAHADYIDDYAFITFLRKIKGSIKQLDCMIEAKKKDESLFQLVRELKKYDDIEWIDESSFYIR